MIRTSRSVVPVSRSLTLALLTGALLAASGFAAADADLDQKIRNPDDWAAQAGDYANHRWSDLKQIDANNVGKLQVAWTMSTGVLRGHEGSPLVIGDMLYMQTPFPNNVYAVSLKDQTWHFPANFKSLGRVTREALPGVSVAAVLEQPVA
jgi:lanthanide-dependent methanol dehydrogenase